MILVRKRQQIVCNRGHFYLNISERLHTARMANRCSRTRHLNIDGAPPQITTTTDSRNTKWNLMGSFQNIFKASIFGVYTLLW